MKKQLLSYLVAACLCPVLMSQVVYYHHNPSTTVGGSNAFPFNQVGGFTTLHFYSAQSLLDAGVAPGSLLTEFAVNSVAGAGGTYNSPMARVLIGHRSGDTPIPNGWETNLSFPSVVHDVTSGPYTFPWTPTSWVPLPGFAAAAFQWDGVRDIAVYLSTSTGVTGGFNALTGTFGRFGCSGVFLATTQTPTTTGFFCMKARMTFSGSPTQAHTPEATLTLDGTTSATHYYGNDFITLGVSSISAANNPYFLFFSPSFAGGHLPLGGQSFDLGDINNAFMDVFGISPAGSAPFLTGPYVPFGTLDLMGNSTFLLQLACGTQFPRIFLQAAILDASAVPLGIRTTGLTSFDAENSCRFAATTTLPLAIPDTATPITASFTAPSGLTINDLDVQIQITHQQVSDLSISLDINGLITVALLVPGPVDPSDLNGTYQFSDEGVMTLDAAALLSGTTLLAGRFRVGENPLSVFDTLDIGGTWTLTVTDTVPANTGTLQGFAILVNGAE